MNILVVTAYPPVLHRHGGGFRMYHNIRLLSEKHNVHVLSFVTDDEEERWLDSLRSISRSVTGIRRIPDFRPHWLSVQPFMVREFSTPEMHRAVDRLIRQENIDVLQCEYLQMAQFRRPQVFCILTEHEVQSKNAIEAFESEVDPFQKTKLFYRWMQLLRYEVGQVRRFDRVITMTPEDAAYLKSYSPTSNIRPVPIGIDPEEFLPVSDGPCDEVAVLFIGNFLHTPNLEAARFLSERLAPKFPSIKFRIVGSPLPDCARTGGNVELTSYVADTRALHSTPGTIVVAPLFSGTGQRVKLLEAFSMACPVITTKVGAMGFPIQSGVQAFLAETEGEFETALRKLIADVDLRRRMGEEARRMILEFFTWNRVGKDLLDVVEEAAVSR